MKHRSGNLRIAGIVVVAGVLYIGFVAGIGWGQDYFDQFPYKVTRVAEGDSFRIEVGPSEGYRHTLEVFNKNSGDRFSIVVEDGGRTILQIQRIKSVEVINDRRAIAAGVSELTGHDMILVIDLDQRKIVDWFTGYGFRLSPDKRFLAYRKYASRAVSNTMSDVYLVYDLTAFPEQNRLSAVVDPEDPVNVGIPIFPPGNGNAPGDNIWVPEAQRNGGTEFAWLGGVNVVAFSDRVPGADPTLVVVDLRDGVWSRTTFTEALRPGILASSRCGRNLESGYYVESIGTSENDPEIVRVEIYSVAPLIPCGNFDISVQGLRLPVGSY